MSWRTRSGLLPCLAALLLAGPAAGLAGDAELRARGEAAVEELGRALETVRALEKERRPDGANARDWDGQSRWLSNAAKTLQAAQRKLSGALRAGSGVQAALDDIRKESKALRDQAKSRQRKAAGKMAARAKKAHQTAMSILDNIKA